jgi:hypothetical protein
MDVKQAIETAKATLRDVFADDILGAVKLEEVEYEPSADTSAITLSFQRQFEHTDTALDTMPQIATRNTTMKIVRVPNASDGPVSIKNYP